MLTFPSLWSIINYKKFMEVGLLFRTFLAIFVSFTIPQLFGPIYKIFVDKGIKLKYQV